MGLFTRMSDQFHDGYPVYKNDNNQYLYYMEIHTEWKMSSDIGNIYSVVAGSHSQCPNQVTNWYYAADVWLIGDLQVSCVRNISTNRAGHNAMRLPRSIPYSHLL